MSADGDGHHCGRAADLARPAPGLGVGLRQVS